MRGLISRTRAGFRRDGGDAEARERLPWCASCQAGHTSGTTGAVQFLDRASEALADRPARLPALAGVQGVIVINADGIPIRTTLDQKTSVLVRESGATRRCGGLTGRALPSRSTQPWSRSSPRRLERC